jgi:glutaryl-CoA dehydrogenase (non-decarboxylating)
MTDVAVPAANLVAKEGEGFKIAMFCLDQGRYTVASGSTGLIRACRDASVKYSLERETFAEPIAHHQLVKQMIANMEAGYEYSRLLWIKAGWKKNQGQPNTRETSLAKWIACREAEAAAANAVQVYGAYGFSDEYPVERFYRNSKGASIYEGTREIHTLMQADYALGLREDRSLREHLPIVGQGD